MLRKSIRRIKGKNGTDRSESGRQSPKSDSSSQSNSPLHIPSKPQKLTNGEVKRRVKKPNNTEEKPPKKKFDYIVHSECWLGGFLKDD